MSAQEYSNEIGVAPARGRPQLDRRKTSEGLSQLVGKPITLGEDVIVSGGPKTCPACGSTELMWGCAAEQARTQDEIHPLVWHETEMMADSFICKTCSAGWIEPDDPKPITWVRPYWRVASA